MSMSQDPQTPLPHTPPITSSLERELRAGLSQHLAEMILEVQQVALRAGAGSVATHLQRAYLESRAMAPGASPNADSTKRV
ncbi:MAG: hypothetical protein AAFZ01_03615 [Pseudomonadota bacterium]